MELKLQAGIIKGNPNCDRTRVTMEQSRPLSQGWTEPFRKVIQLLAEHPASHSHLPTARRRVLLQPLFS